MLAPMDTGLAALQVLITGASGGIGQALADAFADEGAGLVLHAATREGALERFPDAVRLAADLRTAAAAESMVARALAAVDRLDVCIINAGVWPEPDAPLHHLDPQRIRDVIEINLLGAIWTARAFVQALARTGPRADGRGASVCLIGSTAGRFGEAGHLEYAVSKAGLYGLVRSLKNEIVAVDPRARVNMVEPGWTVTPMAAPALAREGLIERVLQTVPLRQLARPEDIAAATVFLSAPQLAAHVTGEVLTVAGGMEGRRLWAPAQIDPDDVRARVGLPRQGR